MQMNFIRGNKRNSGKSLDIFRTEILKMQQERISFVQFISRSKEFSQKIV